MTPTVAMSPDDSVATAAPPAAARARLPIAYPVAVLLAGIAGGVSGVSLALTLHAIQHLAYGYSLTTLVGGETFLDGVAGAAPLRRLEVLAAAGTVAGLGWWAVYRFGRKLVPIATAVADPDRTMPTGATVGHVLLQIVTVALGSTLGREVALFVGDPAAPLPEWPESGPLAVRRKAVTVAGLDAAFDPRRWQRRRPAFFVEHGRAPAARPAREIALRSGIPHLRFGETSAPEVVSTAPALTYRVGGFVSAALVLAALHRRAGQPPVIDEATEEFGLDAGWARLWGELGQLVAA